MMLRGRGIVDLQGAPPPSQHKDRRKREPMIAWGVDDSFRRVASHVCLDGLCLPSA